MEQNAYFWQLLKNKMKADGRIICDLTLLRTRVREIKEANLTFLYMKPMDTYFKEMCGSYICENGNNLSLEKQQETSLVGFTLAQQLEETA